MAELYQQRFQGEDRRLGKLPLRGNEERESYISPQQGYTREIHRKTIHGRLTKRSWETTGGELEPGRISGMIDLTLGPGGGISILGRGKKMEGGGPT